MGVVYRAVCTVNKRVYVGYTTRTLPERRKQHVFDATHRPKSPFHRAIAQYGTTKFRWKVLYTADDTVTLRLKEALFIREERANVPETGYNIPTYYGRCKECGKIFSTERDTALFCSQPCKDRWHYKERMNDATQPGYRKTKKCPSCGALFVTTRDKRRYCYNKTCARRAKVERDKKRREKT